MSSGYPGEPDPPRDRQHDGYGHEYDDEYGDEPTRPVGWQQPAGTSSWDAPTQQQPTYGEQVSYGQGAYDPAAGYPPPPGLYAGRTEHPQATTALVLGICGLVFGLSCGLGFLLSPFAWVLGGRAVREIRASGGRYGGEGAAKAGQVTGIVGTVALVLIVLALVALVAIGLAGGFTSETYSDYGNV